MTSCPAARVRMSMSVASYHREMKNHLEKLLLDSQKSQADLAVRVNDPHKVTVVTLPVRPGFPVSSWSVPRALSSFVVSFYVVVAVLGESLNRQKPTSVLALCAHILVYM